MIENNQKPQAIYTKDHTSQNGFVGSMPTAASTGQAPMRNRKKPKKILGVDARAVFTVISLFLFLLVGLGAVLVSQKQRISKAPVAPNAPASKPSAHVDTTPNCSLTFDIGDTPTVTPTTPPSSLVCNDTCTPGGTPSCPSGQSCIDVGNTGTNALANVGSGDIQGWNIFVHPDTGEIRQTLIRNNDTQHQRFRSASGTWGNWEINTNWDSWISGVGSGPIQAWTIFVHPEGEIRQTLIRDNTYYARSRSAAGVWGTWAENTSGTAGINSIGSGDVQGFNIFVHPDTGEIRQNMIKNNILYQRYRSAAGVWGSWEENDSATTSINSIGSDDIQAWNIFVHPDTNEIRQTLVRDNLLYHRYRSASGTWGSWSETVSSAGTSEYRCRLNNNPTSATCNGNEPTPTPTPTRRPTPTPIPQECGSNPCTDNNNCAGSLICVVAGDGSGGYCSMPEHQTACANNPGYSACCQTPTNPPVPTTPPNVTYPPGVTPMPTGYTIVTTVACNNACSNNTDCANIGHICYEGACRLDSNPTDQYCRLPGGQTTQYVATLPQQPVLPAVLPQTGPADWLNYLKVGLGTLGIGALLLLFL